MAYMYMSNLKIRLWKVKISFAKIWMIRKKPLVVLKDKLGKETNRNETKRKNIERSIYKNSPAEKVTFLIRNNHRKN